MSMLKKKIDISDSEISTLYSVNVFALAEMVKRIHQREDYFLRYHKNLKMSEYKEVGLTAFWITKFQPFSMADSRFLDEKSFNISVKFAVYYIFIALSNLAIVQKKTFDMSSINKDLVYEMEYSLEYRDISKEAMGVLVELLALNVIK